MGSKFFLEKKTLKTMYLTAHNIEFLLILFQKLMGSMEPIEPMLTTALNCTYRGIVRNSNLFSAGEAGRDLRITIIARAYILQKIWGPLPQI